MLEIDGSAGGGQLVRTASSLAALTGTPVRITGIRQARSTPGLKAQHRAAIQTAAAITDAEVTGLELGSEQLTFDPRTLDGGRYEVDVGTAGSLTLVFDTVLPLVYRMDAPLAIAARGGTDVKWSPPLDYYRRVKVPALGRAGLIAAVEPHRRGFYPAGGGHATLRAAPADPGSLTLVDRGALRRIHVSVTAAEDLADGEVAERTADAAAERLADADLPVAGRTIRYVETDSPGVVAVVSAHYENGVAGFDAFGEKGTPAEDVGEAAADDAIGFHGTRAAVDAHLADQLLLPLALAGGRVSAPRVTAHVETSLDLFAAFGLDLSVEPRDASVEIAGPDDPLLAREPPLSEN